MMTTDVMEAYDINHAINYLIIIQICIDRIEVTSP